MKEYVLIPLILSIVAMLPGTHVDYYPAFLDKKDVDIGFSENQTTITINKQLQPVVLACTGSMQPAIGCNNTALVEELSETDEVYVGDIVAYKKDDIYIMHQIVSKDNNCYYLKGLNNLVNDPLCVKRSDIKLRTVLVLPTSSSEYSNVKKEAALSR